MAFIPGTPGADTLRGADTGDGLFGDAGNDWLYGGMNRDNLDGGDGADRLFGEFQDDWLFGGSGGDQGPAAVHACILPCFR